MFTQCIAIHVTSFHITKQKKKKRFLGLFTSTNTIQQAFKYRNTIFGDCIKDFKEPYTNNNYAQFPEHGYREAIVKPGLLLLVFLSFQPKAS